MRLLSDCLLRLAHSGPAAVLSCSHHDMCPVAHKTVSYMIQRFHKLGLLQTGGIWGHSSSCQGELISKYCHHHWFVFCGCSAYYESVHVLHPCCFVLCPFILAHGSTHMARLCNLNAWMTADCSTSSALLEPDALPKSCEVL